MSKLRKVQAQRKFAQGAYIPPQASHNNNNITLERRGEHYKPAAPPAVMQDMSAFELLDIVSFQSVHLHEKKLTPVVRLERLPPPAPKRLKRLKRAVLPQPRPRAPSSIGSSIPLAWTQNRPNDRNLRPAPKSIVNQRSTMVETLGSRPISPYATSITSVPLAFRACATPTQVQRARRIGLRASRVRAQTRLKKFVKRLRASSRSKRKVIRPSKDDTDTEDDTPLTLLAKSKNAIKTDSSLPARPAPATGQMRTRSKSPVGEQPPAKAAKTQPRAEGLEAFYTGDNIERWVKQAVKLNAARSSPTFKVPLPPKEIKRSRKHESPSSNPAPAPVVAPTPAPVVAPTPAPVVAPPPASVVAPMPAPLVALELLPVSVLASSSPSVAAPAPPPVLGSASPPVVAPPPSPALAKALEARKSNATPLDLDKEDNKSIASSACPSERYLTVRDVITASPSERRLRCMTCKSCNRANKVEKLSKVMQASADGRDDVYEFDTVRDGGDGSVCDSGMLKQFRERRGAAGHKYICLNLMPTTEHILILTNTDVSGRRVLQVKLMKRSEAKTMSSDNLVGNESLFDQLIETMDSLPPLEQIDISLPPTPPSSVAESNDKKRKKAVKASKNKQGRSRKLTKRNSGAKFKPLKESKRKSKMGKALSPAKVEKLRIVLPTEANTTPIIRKTKARARSATITKSAPATRKKGAKAARSMAASPSQASQLTLAKGLRPLSLSQAPVAGPSRTPVAGPFQAPVAGPSRTPVAGPSRATVAGLSRTPVAGPSRASVAGPSRLPITGPSQAPAAGHSRTTAAGIAGPAPDIADLAEKPVKPPSVLRDAPVYYPTESEFNDPVAYFEKIMPSASKFGICKVVAPASFRPRCLFGDKIRFSVANQYIARLYIRWGQATRDMCAIKAYLASQSVTFSRAPFMDSVELDLPRLYRTVQRHGGLKTVIEKKRWGRVAEDMRFVKGAKQEKKLDEFYVRYLLPYDTLSTQERESIKAAVAKAWHKKNGKIADRAMNPLHRQKQLLGESPCSSDTDEESDDISHALQEAEDCIVTGRRMSLIDFAKVAQSMMENHFHNNPTPTPQQVEEAYWRLVLLADEHVCVNTASIDTGDEGYGFPINKTDPYGRHPWNLKMISQNPGNVLHMLGSVLGVTVPTLHLGMLFSTSCWHRDPHGLPWIEYMHSGPAKIWYGIPDDQSAVFRMAVETLCPTAVQNKSIWLPSDITMIPPNFLLSAGVSLTRVEQKPGEYIIVFPKSYSSSISTGFTQSESVYFATKSWLKTVDQVFQELRDSCEPTMFSLEQLLISVARDPRAPPSLLQLVHTTLASIMEDEKQHRMELKKLGVPLAPAEERREPSKKPAGAWNVREQDECEVCRATLYLSKVTGLPEKNSAVCLSHALLLLTSKKVPPRDVSELALVVNFHVEELDEVMAKLQHGFVHQG